MAKIKVGEKWRFFREANNYTLEELRNVQKRQTGEVKKEWVEVGYFGKLNGLYAHLIERDAMSAHSLGGVVKKMNAMFKAILEITNASD